MPSPIMLCQSLLIRVIKLSVSIKIGCFDMWQISKKINRLNSASLWTHSKWTWKDLLYIIYNACFWSSQLVFTKKADIKIIYFDDSLNEQTNWRLSTHQSNLYRKQSQFIFHSKPGLDSCQTIRLLRLVQMLPSQHFLDRLLKGCLIFGTGCVENKFWPPYRHL